MLFKIALLISMLHHFLSTLGHHHSLRTDRAALLSFKTSITYDPNSRLDNWNESTGVCSFTGVQCGLTTNHRVVYLNLNDSGLVGALSPVISNLTQLKYLHLVGNHFHGSIPQDLSSLRNLIEIKLGSNNLGGQIPASFALLSKLRLILLYDNALNGTIPPSFFANCTGLRNIDFSENQLSGSIPSEIGNCPDLWSVSLYNNRFSGEIPPSFGNATGMISLDLENNTITGIIPAEIISKFHALLYLHLSDNNMISHHNNTSLDTFFAALANCTVLEELELAGMGLGGALTSSIACLSSNINTFQLQENMIHGLIPSAIGNLSHLTLLNLTSNLLNGTIPPQIGKLLSLEQLSLSHNFFKQIPPELGRLSSLGLLDLSHNSLSGSIPREVGSFVSLSFLFLNNNLLSGEIPPTIGECTALQKIDLSYNKLTGRVPPNITSLQEMRWFLNLSHNQLDGLLPVELSKLEKVEEIDLSCNRFTGTISGLISSCYALRLLNFSNNKIQGALPSSLSDLKSIVAMDFSSNQLSGEVPASLNTSKTLSFLNLSNNNFEGLIPTGGVFTEITYLSFLHNPNLCGSVAGLPPCKDKHGRKRNYFRSRSFLMIIFCVMISISVLLFFCMIISCRRRRRRRRRQTSDADAPPQFTRNFPRITHKELVAATAGFDEGRLVGSGSYGHVYLGILEDGARIAVKVLHLQTRNSTRSFKRECEVLKRIRHRNLMRIVTACSLPEFKALVLPYMENGSLDALLHSRRRVELTLPERVNICSDIAQGMAYLHHHSPVKVIHCDLKPSNVLLNDDMTALVSDFGISRLVMTVEGGGSGNENVGNSTANMLCGSIGYIAPEYGLGSEMSTKGDVYSFGVVVMEMVTMKRPTDEMLVEGGLSLHNYAKNAQVEKVVDPYLLGELRDQSPQVMRMWKIAMGELIELGLVCTQESPSLRPTMLDCAHDLDRLKSFLVGDTTATFSSSLGISSSTITHS